MRSGAAIPRNPTPVPAIPHPLTQQPLAQGEAPGLSLPARRLYYSRPGPPQPGDLTLDKQALIDALNSDLAHEYAAIIQYIQYSAKVRGPWRTELKTFLQNEIPDEQTH
ncbi:MAG TPA: ferritin-like domain-containing protein, partial [Armatimonadota bacterium]|nr:ferritin-like domain-containing protein [Armatimonadota bacterium]